MGNAQILLEAALVFLLGATLFHALRLERALGVLKRDRAVLEALVAGFNDSTRQAEIGVERLRSASEGAGRQIARQIEQAQRLRDDLSFLTERGDKLAERLEGGVRSARMFADQSAMTQGAPARFAPALAETARFEPAAPAPARFTPAPAAVGEPAPRLRSEAERDLLRALRAAR
jgi:hypothetical protein